MPFTTWIRETLIRYGEPNRMSLGELQLYRAYLKQLFLAICLIWLLNKIVLYVF